jgi:hypothetical protein
MAASSSLRGPAAYVLAFKTGAPHASADSLYDQALF